MENTDHQPLLFALGNTFIDWSGTTDRSLLEKYNIAFGVPGNLTEEQLPVFKDLESSDDYHEMPGGSSINTIRAVNYLMDKNGSEGYNTLYFGTIGKDEKGETVKKLFDEEKILYRMNEQEGKHTGQCAIIIVDGERTPLSNWGVNDFFETQHFTENIDALESPNVFYVEGKINNILSISENFI